MDKFLEILFDPGELVCAGGRYDTGVHSQNDIKSGSEFISINPLNEKRLDANVTAYRNFLIELDHGSIEEQLQYIKDSALPVSTITFSGGKSLHFIVSLDKPLRNADTWKQYAKWLVQILDKADPSTTNPSRFTRLAGGLRADNQVVQELIEANGRISRDALEAFLERHAAKLEIKVPEPIVFDYENNKTIVFTNFTKRFLRGEVLNNRNHALFFAGKEFQRKGLTYKDAYEKLYPVARQIGLGEWETLQTLRSAFRGEIK